MLLPDDGKELVNVIVKDKYYDSTDLTGLTIEIDSDLRETNGGLWEGKTGAENRAEQRAASADGDPHDGFE